MQNLGIHIHSYLGLLCLLVSASLPGKGERIELSFFVMCGNQNIYPISPQIWLQIRIMWKMIKILVPRHYVRPAIQNPISRFKAPRAVPVGSLVEVVPECPPLGPALGLGPL